MDDGLPAGRWGPSTAGSDEIFQFYFRLIEKHSRKLQGDSKSLMKESLCGAHEREEKEEGLSRLTYRKLEISCHGRMFNSPPLPHSSPRVYAMTITYTITIERYPAGMLVKVLTVVSSQSEPLDSYCARCSYSVDSRWRYHRVDVISKVLAPHFCYSR